ncbi:MAG: metallophosphoesterase family protein [Planctomycetota bacterium]
MRTLAIGDIHGCSTALRALAALVGFRDDDTLVTLGDYVDKGPDVRGVLDWLCDRAERFPGRLIALRGNHDQMMLDARRDPAAFSDWWLCGGAATLDSYPPARNGDPLAAVPDHHWDWLGSTRLYHEDAGHLYVHGNLDPALPLDRQPIEQLLWAKFVDPRPHVSGKVMFAGHTSQKDGEVVDLGHAVCIDTWAVGQGWLTCCEPATGRLWHADRAGRTRRGRLQPRDSKLPIRQL